MPLTDRQKKTYDFLRTYSARHGVSPKLREIADYLGIQSRGTVHRYLTALVDAKLISITPDLARGIVLLEAEAEFKRFTLPLVGRIAATG